MKTSQYFFDSHLPHSSHPSTPPSCLAAAAVACAALVYYIAANPETTSAATDTLWTPTLKHYTTYNLASILVTCKEMMGQVLAAITDTTKLTGAITKYKSFSQHQRLVLSKHLTVKVLQKSSLVLSEW